MSRTDVTFIRSFLVMQDANVAVEIASMTKSGRAGVALVGTLTVVNGLDVRLESRFLRKRSGATGLVALEGALVKVNGANMTVEI